MIAFQTTIPARAITQIILVALKYSFFKRYKIVNPGNTQKKPNKNVNIITPPIAKLLNCATINK